MNSSSINDLLLHMRPMLRRIASQTKGETTVGDLENDAYLLILEFIDKQLREPTLDDASWIIGRISNKNIKWGDHKFRNAIRLEGLVNDEEDSFVLDLPAPSSSNPLTEILDREELLEHQEALANSYSEAKAYVISFNNFNYDRALLSDYFFIKTKTLNNRIDRAILVFQHQPSLFDAIEFIDESFMPKPGLEKSKKANTADNQQLALKLDTALQ